MKPLSPLESATQAITKATAAVEKASKEKTIPFKGKGKPATDEPEEDGPLFFDLAGLLKAGLKQELPSVAPCLEGKFVFYKSAINEIHAEPSVGKTNVGIAAIIAETYAGGVSLYLDPEDTAKGFLSRLISLSGGDPRIIEAINTGKILYIHDPSEQAINRAQKWAVENKPTLVLLDGLAELMAAEGLNEDVPGDVLRFFRNRARPFAEKAGSAVVISDHVVKNGNGNGYARGSGAKLGRYDGVSYELSIGEAYSPDQSGFVKMKISKDRKGGVGPKGKHVLDLHFEPTGKTFGDGEEAIKLTSFRWEEPACAENGAPMPTQKMAEIIEYLETVSCDTSTSIRKAVGGKGQTVDWAIKCLVQDKQIERFEKGNSKRYRLPKPEQIDPKDFPAGESKHSAARGKV